MKKKNKRAFPRQLPLLVVVGILLLGILVQAFIPIDKVRVGECGPVKPTRLSMLAGGKEKIEQAKQRAIEIRENKQQPINKNGGLPGCIVGPTYELYLLF